MGHDGDELIVVAGSFAYIIERSFDASCLVEGIFVDCGSGGDVIVQVDYQLGAICEGKVADGLERAGQADGDRIAIVVDIVRTGKGVGGDGGDAFSYDDALYGTGIVEPGVGGKA